MNREGLKGEDETLDTFYQGRILALQKKHGYRFSIDAPLLADFIQTEEGEDLLELGAGNGIISLLLSIKKFRSITAVEIQTSLADLARRNVFLNNLQERIQVVYQDLRSFDPGIKYDVIFSNPPYHRKDNGHQSINLEKAIAKHELKCEIFDIMHTASRLLKKKGRAYFIFPVRRQKEFMQAVERVDLEIAKRRDVCPRDKSAPNLFLSECGFSSDASDLLPPLILLDQEGKYTAEAQEILSGRQHDTFT
jgi:tRNA1(Val) A37 N6-methylase TrmN6